MTEEAPRIEVTISASIDEVWRALRDPVLISRWHGWHYEGLDDEVRVIFVDGAAADVDNHVLTMRDGDRFSLHPVPEGVVVRITRAPRGSNPQWDAYYEDITEGWKTFLQQLRFGLERHGLAPRRTLLLTGALREPGTPALTALGLAPADEPADEPPVGARYRATAAPGDTLAGEVFARVPHQLMLTVDDLGPGLLIVAQAPPTDARPHGLVMILLTAYGTSDDTFADLERRWTAWWDEVRMPDPEPATT